MNGLDIAIICILGFTFIRGIMTGLMQSISGLIGAVAGFYAAYLYYPLLADFFSKWINKGSTLNIASFLAIFFAVLIAVTILGRLMKWVMKIAFLGWVDRLGGGVLGLLKGAIVISALVVLLTTFLPSGSKLLKGSSLVPYVSGVSETMMQIVPDDMSSKNFTPKMEELKKMWKKAEDKINGSK